MKDFLTHEIELYPYDKFETLLEHEVNRSRRYGSPLSLIHLTVEAESGGADAQYGAEIFAINALNLHVRETDIPCRQGKEFLVLMPSTDEHGGRVVCERFEKLFYAESQIYDKVSFKLSTFIGMTTLPGDRSISSKKLMEQAAKAMEHARTNRLQKTVVYSEIKT